MFSSKTCELKPTASKDFPAPLQDLPATEGKQVAILAGGCFWCTEGVFARLKGVESVVSGYIGGEARTANYKAVCNGDTNHAEALKITYDPSQVSYGTLLKVFFSVAHDPTQLNRQGNDRGTQYRSAIFYSSDEEKSVALAYIKQLNDAGQFALPIVTTLEPFTEFYPAEEYHQNYAELNPYQPYIASVALPKIDKLKKAHKDLLKEKV